MKKVYFLLLLSFVLTGCASKPVVTALSVDHAVGVSGKSVAFGKVKFVGVPGEFRQAWLGWEDEVASRQYPVSLGVPAIQGLDSAGRWTVEYYFFIELPPGHYAVPTVIAQHSRFQEFATHFLNANLTIKENTVVYVGTILVEAIGRSLEHIGPMTETQIIDEFPQVEKILKERYPQFAGVTIEKNIIDRYRWFKGDHIQTNFD